MAVVSTPHITTISPGTGPIGTLVTIIGTNFGAIQSTSTVTLGSTVAAVSLWSDTQIKVTVPSLSAGTYDVMVTTNAGSSNLVSFQIISSGPTIAINVDSARVWANGHEKTEIIVSVLNPQGQGVAGRTVQLRANPPTGVTITPSSGNATTDTFGKALFVATSTKIGPVVFTATDVRNPALVASAQVEFIQRRVSVFVQGINTALSPETEDTVFSAIRGRLVALGFSRPSYGPAEIGIACTNAADDDGDGVPNDGCPLILNYSYDRGLVNPSTGIWQPFPYTCSDTADSLNASIEELGRLLRDFTRINPNTRFIRNAPKVTLCL